MKAVTSIEISLNALKEGLVLYIDSRRANTLFDAEASASDNNEARFQLMEGNFYDYTFSDADFTFEETTDRIVQPHSRRKETGTLAPNIFVGTLSLSVLKKVASEAIGTVELEVQSVKSGYRDDYRDMLEFITEKCTDLILRANSPASQYFDIDYTKDSQSLYQKFAFVKSVIGTEEFSEAIHRIVSSPVTRWSETSESKDVRQTRRFTNAAVRELVKGGNRTRLPDTHYLQDIGLATLPNRIRTTRKTDSVDTPENRFIKHALEVFLKFCTDINNATTKNSKLSHESSLLIRELESQLHHSIFREISRPDTLKLNSPVLQRKEGYREILRAWLMFDLAAKLIWQGGDDIYSGGKKDVAVLYEYWLFFKLLDLLQSSFDIKSKDISDLIEETNNGLNLKLKQGKFTALRGVYNAGSRRLQIRFNYNRSFSGSQPYPNSGSWTTTLRPDYTLSIWPHGISETEAEQQELIVHIHFDAKYKIANLHDFLGESSEENLNEEKTENRGGIYKNADLLKMHAYKDAIRRTGGAYVLYPGDKPINQKGFHEIIPGLGAFPVKPSKSESGISDLKAFILTVIDHFINRASQREKIAFSTFDVYKKAPELQNEVKELLPEPYNTNRNLLPDSTYVLVGFYNSEEQYNWIKKTGMYNFRMGSGSGSLVLNKETVGAKYLLLHTAGDNASGNLWEIIGDGPRVFSKDNLLKKGYPSPSQENYLVLNIKPVASKEFKNVAWNFKELTNYTTGRASASPFTTTLSELMKNKAK